MKLQLTLHFDSVKEMNEVVSLLNKSKPKECDRPKEYNKPTPKPKPESKKAGVSEKPKTLDDLSKLAQGLLETVDRVIIKKTISKYGDRLSEVNESDYNSLYSDLLKLKG